MSRIILFIIMASTGHACAAQFYPETNAVWCIWRTAFDPGYAIQLRLGHVPDTVLSGRTYRIITEHSNLGGSWMDLDRFYIRNSDDGKGYMFLLDSMAEFVTGDVSALQNDTVLDVLVRTPNGYLLRDLVVDSIVMLNHEGISIERQHVDLTFSPLDFWQRGAGASHGPCLTESDLSGYDPRCIVVNDTVLFRSDSSPVFGLPGGPICCVDFTLGMGSAHPSMHAAPLIHPNPSTGLYNFTRSTNAVEKHVLDHQGRLLLVTSEDVIDLSDQPPGVYTAVLRTPAGPVAQRLVVLR